MEKKKKIKRFAAYAIGVITLGAICYYKRDTLKCAAKTLTKALKGGGKVFRPNVILSEEIKVIPQIVSGLTDAATLINEGVVSDTGEMIVAKVFSNMASHPNSGRLEIPLDGLSPEGVAAVKHHAKKVMGRPGEIINNTLCFG